MKYLVLIQARMGSSRLPSKVMKDICGKPDIEWVVERVKRSKRIDEVMVITSIDRNNLPLIRKCADMGIRVFVGSEDDVLDRYYQCARLLQPKYVIRITADCPMYDWNVLDFVIDAMNPETDYISICGEDFPDGLDTEIMKYEALEKSWKEAHMYSEREHVTQYVRKHPDLFHIQEYIFPIPDTGHYRWTLDEDADYEMIRKVYEHFISIGKEDFATEDVIRFLKEHPEVEEINSGIGRNEGLVKSINEDYVVAQNHL